MTNAEVWREWAISFTLFLIVLVAGSLLLPAGFLRNWWAIPSGFIALGLYVFIRKYKTR